MKSVEETIEAYEKTITRFATERVVLAAQIKESELDAGKLWQNRNAGRKVCSFGATFSPELIFRHRNAWSLACLI